MNIRLNKFLSQSGLASRREADRLIEEGRVKVNRRLVLTLGSKVNAVKDRIEVDGKVIQPASGLVYMVLHKPVGYLVTRKDPFERPTVMELLPGMKTRLFPVGRLDYESQGILLLTNDGELCNRLLHPRYKIIKTYVIRVKGKPAISDLKKLEKGIYLDKKKTSPSKIFKLRENQRETSFKVELHEGRKREIRRMFAIIGHEVQALKRVNFAGISLGKLKTGQWRYLSPQEVDSLKKKTGLESA
jgi:pseudouridine synthase